jgi:hypothetical protein
MQRFHPTAAGFRYTSDESGRAEVYVRAFPATAGGRWLVSSNGGAAALWLPNGRELLYRSGGTVMSVAYKTVGNSFVTDNRGRGGRRFAPSLASTVAPDGRLAVTTSVAGGDATAPRTLRRIRDQFLRRAAAARANQGSVSPVTAPLPGVGRKRRSLTGK